MLTLSLEVHDGVGTVQVAGEVDHLTAPELRQVAFAALNDGASSLVLECSEMTYIDSSGFNVLLEANRAAEARAGTIKLRNPRPFVRRMVEATLLNSVLVTEP